MSARDPRIDDLPESIKPVAEHLGYAAAASLVDAFPGYRLHIPKTLREGHMLCALGDHAGPLCEHFGGDVITVPLNLMTAEARERRILTLRAEGLNANEIAGRVGCTRRRVLDILAGKSVRPVQRRPRDERQIDLVEWLSSDAAASRK